MLIVMISLSISSLHHAKGQKMIARVRALHIEDDRSSVAREGSLDSITGIAVAEERKKWIRIETTREP